MRKGTEYTVLLFPGIFWPKYVPRIKGVGAGGEIISIHIVQQIRGDENFPIGGSFYNLIMSNKAKDCFLFMFQLK